MFNRRKLLKLSPALLLPALGVQRSWAQSPFCPTRPTGDATNACASDAFVQNSVALTAPFDSAAYYGLSLNAGHEVSQANVDSSVSIAPGGGSVNPYTTDMHKIFAQGTFTATAQRVTDAPPGFQYSMKITITGTQAVLGANDSLHLNHFVEGWKSSRLMLGLSTSLSFVVAYLVKTSINNQIVCSSATNLGLENRNWINRQVLQSGVWTPVIYVVGPETTGTWATQSTASLGVKLDLLSGSNSFGVANQWNTGVIQDCTSDITNMAATNGATFQYVGPFIFPGIQVPPVAALPNLVRYFPEELALARRYYWKSFLSAVVPAQNAGNGTGEVTFPALQAGATAQKSSIFLLPSLMRTLAPTMTLYNPAAANAQARDKTAAADCSGTVSASDEAYFFIACTGNAATAIANTLAIHATLDSRM